MDGRYQLFENHVMCTSNGNNMYFTLRPSNKVYIETSITPRQNVLRRLLNAQTRPVRFLRFTLI